METDRKRRKRSEMSISEAHKAFGQFAAKVERFKETNDGCGWGVFQNGMWFAPRGQIVVAFLVNGGFGVGDDVFEAVRVLAGHKLPRKG